jgi:hypothetical protein
MLITAQEQILPSRCLLHSPLQGVPLSSEEDLHVPRRGREEIRLWPVVIGSPYWLCPRIWHKGIRKANASSEWEITQRMNLFFFLSKPIFFILFSFWVSSTIRSVIALKRTMCWKNIPEVAVINLKSKFIKLI